MANEAFSRQELASPASSSAHQLEHLGPLRLGKIPETFEKFVQSSSSWSLRSPSSQSQGQVDPACLLLAGWIAQPEPSHAVRPSLAGRRIKKVFVSSSLLVPTLSYAFRSSVWPPARRLWKERGGQEHEYVACTIVQEQP